MANDAGAVAGSVKTIMKLEGLAVLALCLLLYHRLDFGWTMFAIFFLAPDLSMLGYLGGSRIGAICYNTAHAYIGPLAVGAFALITADSFDSLASIVTLIWTAHIGFDRALGFGLKYSRGFRFTHLGTIGRQSA
jgi:hypothetical protein